MPTLTAPTITAAQFDQPEESLRLGLEAIETLRKYQRQLSEREGRLPDLETKHRALLDRIASAEFYVFDLDQKADRARKLDAEIVEKSAQAATLGSTIASYREALAKLKSGIPG